MIQINIRPMSSPGNVTSVLDSLVKNPELAKTIFTHNQILEYKKIFDKLDKPKEPKT